jgi:dual-specificity kinase
LRNFLDLLKKIFVYDPDARITAKEALQHPWFKEVIHDDGTEAARIFSEKTSSCRSQTSSRSSTT